MTSIPRHIVQTDKIFLALKQNLKYSMNRMYLKKKSKHLQNRVLPKRANDIAEMNELREFPNCYPLKANSNFTYLVRLSLPLSIKRHISNPLWLSCFTEALSIAYCVPRLIGSNQW